MRDIDVLQIGRINLTYTNVSCQKNKTKINNKMTATVLYLCTEITSELQFRVFPDLWIPVIYWFLCRKYKAKQNQSTNNNKQYFCGTNTKNTFLKLARKINNWVFQKNIGFWYYIKCRTIMIMLWWKCKNWVQINCIFTKIQISDIF